MAGLQLALIEKEREVNPTALEHQMQVITKNPILDTSTEDEDQSSSHRIGAFSKPSVRKTQCKELEESACEEHMKEVSTFTGRDSGITPPSSGVRRHVQRLLT